MQNQETSTTVLTLLSHQAGSKYMTVPSFCITDHFVMDTVETASLKILINRYHLCSKNHYNSAHSTNYYTFTYTTVFSTE
jgi:hypothetical protein